MTTPNRNDRAVYLFRHLVISEQARRVVLEDKSLSSRAWFTRLMALGYYTDALQVLAHLMPRRVGVWWAMLAVWDSYRPEPPQPVSDAVSTVLGWLVDSNEKHRQELKQLLEVHGPATAIGTLCRAAYYCDDLTQAEPDQSDGEISGTSQFIAACVLLTASSSLADRTGHSMIAQGTNVQRPGMAFLYRRSIELGLRVANASHLRCSECDDAAVSDWYARQSQRSSFDLLATAEKLVRYDVRADRRHDQVEPHLPHSQRDSSSHLRKKQA